jgi:hypothetical protein
MDHRSRPGCNHDHHRLKSWRGLIVPRMINISMGSACDPRREHSIQRHGRAHANSTMPRRTSPRSKPTSLSIVRRRPLRLRHTPTHAGWLRLCPESRPQCEHPQDPWRGPGIGHGWRCWTTCEAGTAAWPVPRFIDDRDRRSGGLPIIHYRKTVLGAWR